MKVFEVIKHGLFTTVQDIGRYGYLKYGIPVAGAMDQFSLVAANCLVENDSNSGCLETTLIGPELRILTKTQIAITGGVCSPRINDSNVEMWRTINVQEGDVLSFGRMQGGCRAYIAIRGGVNVPLLLGSRSTYVRGGFGGIDGRPLKSGDIVNGFGVGSLSFEYSMPEELIPNFTSQKRVHVVMGPQADMFTENALCIFLSNQYTVTTNSDRMGYRLEGPTIEHKEKADIVSDALLPGAIQVPRDGKPLLIMRDAQTTGGYTKIAAAVTSDLSSLGQVKPLDTLEFCKVTLKEAHEKLWEYTALVNSISRKLLKNQ